VIGVSIFRIPVIALHFNSSVEREPNPTSTIGGILRSLAFSLPSRRLRENPSEWIEPADMPLDLRHPTAPHEKLKLPEWYISNLMMDRALDAICRRVKKIDRKHDIPYLAGYSLDGNTIYIDRHMPLTFKFKGRIINIDRFLILHEAVEKALIDRLGLHYLHAHQIATRAEEAAVRAAGIDWREYDRFVQKNVKRIGDERLSEIPDDLDTKPYRDEHDEDLLRRMLDCIERGQVPKGVRKQQLNDTASELRQYVRRRQKVSVHSPKSSKAAVRTKRKRT
jgi:hypothetical protein